jgi:large subunit ribosomal protein L23
VNEERILTVLRAPHVSEKTMGADRQYVFKVMKDATKPQIKKAVENLFEVTVDQVRVVNMKGKVTRFGQRAGRHKDWKKAYVTLAEGCEIEIAGSQS